MIGEILSHYRITGKVGAGGMGEVYRAHDPRLDREVAIKIMPGSASRDPMRIERFQREARAAGALNHPNVLAIYDVGTHDGAPYIVSELLVGSNLRDRMVAGDLTRRTALGFASKIAEGLEDLGQRERAIEWIERALDAGLTPAWIDRRPGLRELASDPRYRTLIDARNQAGAAGS